MFFELFSLKIKLCICIKVYEFRWAEILTPPRVEAAQTAVQGMEVLWQELKDSCSCSYMSNCHRGV